MSLRLSRNRWYVVGVLGRADPREPEQSSRHIALPVLVTDPIWSLKQWPVIVQLGGDDLTIPAMPAADWLVVLMVNDFDPEAVFPGLLSAPDQLQVEDHLHHGILTLEEVHHVSMEIISMVSGRPWWVSLRLIHAAAASWDALGGDLVRKADAAALSLSAWLDVLFLLIVRSIDDANRTMFLLKLEMAPTGWGPEPEELEMSGDAFLAMAGE